MESNLMDGDAIGTWNGDERRSSWNCENCATILSETEVRGQGKAGLSLRVDVLGTAAAVGLGVAVFYATGLAESEPGWVRSLMGFATVFWMVGMVRLGLSGD